MNKQCILEYLIMSIGTLFTCFSIYLLFNNTDLKLIMAFCVSGLALTNLGFTMYKYKILNNKIKKIIEYYKNNS